MSGGKKALLVSEVGWRGMKEFSYVLLKEGLSVNIIIKGSVNKAVLKVITKPQGLRIRAIPKIFFRAYLFFYLLWHKRAGGIQTTVASKSQTAEWIRGFGINTQILMETQTGYELQ